MTDRVHLLLIDDEEGMLTSLKKLLEMEGYVVSTALSAETGMEIVQNDRIDLVLCDIVMPDVSGLLFIPRVSRRIPVVMITAYASIETARKAFKLGARDYLVKPFDLNELLIVIRQNLNKADARTQIAPADGISLQSADPHFLKMLRLAEKFSATDSPILITGESGTGKEIIANHIHSHSSRSSHPFQKVNCAAIPETLLESELFGYEKGAFTGAVRSKMGRLEGAQHGTFLFDEIGDMSLELQAKLLRVLQNYTFARLGGTKDITVDCRVIAASNKDLDLLVSRKLFREDLLYRINALQIRIPALRERKDDIAGFVHFFLSMFNAKYSKNIAAVDPGAFALLNGYDWPGNVRELKNCIERAAIVCEGDAISISDLPESLVRWERSDDDVLPPSANYRSEYMRKLIVATLERTEGNKSDAARVLKVSRRTLYNWLRDFRIGHE